jgi:hypothetical protein
MLGQQPYSSPSLQNLYSLSIMLRCALGLALRHMLLNISMCIRGAIAGAARNERALRANLRTSSPHCRD